MRHPYSSRPKWQNGGLSPKGDLSPGKNRECEFEKCSLSLFAEEATDQNVLDSGAAGL